MTKRVVCCVALFFAAFGARPLAHDIPADVLVQMFVKPEAQTLHVVVRVPLAAMRDVNFPIHGQGFLNFPVPDRLLRDAAKVWITDAIDVYEGDRRLDAPQIVGTQISVMSDRSFTAYSAATAHLAESQPRSDVELIWNQALFDVAFDYQIASDHSKFSIRPALARLGVRTVTTLRFLPAGGIERAFEYTADPGLIRLDPRWHQAALQFVRRGFEHILSGTDHLLFLFCLVLPFRKLRQLVLIVTSFTVAHSITLIASALNAAPGGLWFPPLIESLIAISILYMALENIVISAGNPRSGNDADRPAASSPREPEGRAAPNGAYASGGGAPRALINDGRVLKRRLLITFCFGLIHGFGFSFALKQTLQFAGTHVLTSLFAFNIGVELGQVLVLIVMIPVLVTAFRWVVAERIGVIIASAFVAHTAWHWAGERIERLRQFSVPAMSPGLLVNITRVLIVMVVIAGSVWWLRLAKVRRQKSEVRSVE